jgi:hypothetical protein
MYYIHTIHIHNVYLFYIQTGELPRIIDQDQDQRPMIDRPL